MRVLLITAWYPTKNNPISGIFVKEIERALSKFVDVEVLHVRSPFKISKSIQRPDIVHLHVYKAGFPALILKRLYRIPYVATEHYKLFDGGWSIAKRFFAKIVLENSDMLVLPSEAMVKEIEKCGIKNRFKIVPNTVNTELFKPKIGEEGRILFVGGLEDIKGLEYLFHAIRILAEKRRDFVLDVVGDGDRKRYEGLARELGIKEFIRFHGLKSKREVAEFMRRCSFFVLPSLWESQGCVLIEAMASGKPVIATMSGGPKEIVKDFCGILVPPRNVKALADAMDRLLDEYDEFDWRAIANYAKSNFGYDSVGRRLLRIYEMILHESGSLQKR